MTGLIKYDLMQIGSGVKGGFVLVYLIFMAFLSVISDIGSLFSYIIVFVGVMFGIAAFNYEEGYHWDRYTAALPVSVKQIVLARYGTVGTCLVGGWAAGALLTGISFVTGNMDMTASERLVGMAQILLVSIVYTEIMIPVMYRFGAERGRIFMLVLFIALFSGICAVGKIMEVASVEQLAVLQISWQYIMIGCAVVVLALLPVSIAISARIRAKKEF